MAKDNVPASISLATALRQNNIEKLMASQEANYDAILIDAPGVDSVVMDTIIDHSDIVITPIQPAQDEIKAVGEAAEAIATRTDVLDRSIPQAVLRTRITIVNRHLEEYRIIRPFVQNLSEHGYNSVLLDTELIERNCYREIRSGLGTLQMLEPSKPVLKARAEVNAFVEELEQLKRNTAGRLSMAKGKISLSDFLSRNVENVLLIWIKTLPPRLFLTCKKKALQTLEMNRRS